MYSNCLALVQPIVIGGVFAEPLGAVVLSVIGGRPAVQLQLLSVKQQRQLFICWRVEIGCTSTALLCWYSK